MSPASTCAAAGGSGGHGSIGTGPDDIVIACTLPKQRMPAQRLLRGPVPQITFARRVAVTISVTTTTAKITTSTSPT